MTLVCRGSRTTQTRRRKSFLPSVSFVFTCHSSTGDGFGRHFGRSFVDHRANCGCSLLHSMTTLATREEHTQADSDLYGLTFSPETDG
jgi:hypothetical protein